MTFYTLAEKYDGKDRFYLEALGIAAGKDRSAARLSSPTSASTSRPSTTRPSTSSGSCVRRETAALIEKNLGDEKLPAARRDRLIDILVGSDDKESGRTLISCCNCGCRRKCGSRWCRICESNLSGKWQYLRQSPELTKLITNRSSPTADHETAMILIAAAGRVDMLAVVEKHGHCCR